MERHESDRDLTLTAPEDPSSLATIDDDGSLESRYATRGRLGVGGMGEIRLCDDRRIGREVAMKVARADRDAPPQARFLHEARLQAQLEHPSIAPVYDVGLDRTGAPYFTMKRVRGLTLRHVLKLLQSGTPETVAKYSRRRLLSAFANVCLAVDYAHARDIVHRDLKPSNIMLGEFGELYVLDWGVARVEGAFDETPTSQRGRPEPQPDAPPRDIVGTAGYIAPEQLRGGPVDARSDVYSLGAILYEILTLEPLLTGDTVAAMKATLAPVDARPSVRTPERDIPPELDAVCTKATALAPEDRYPSARLLHDAVDAFLEGDRDLERRRELAASHARMAGRFADRALREWDAGAEAAGRARAMGEVSRALGLDPANLEARRVLIRLLTEPPRQLPKEAREEIDRRAYAQQQATAKSAAVLFACWFLTPFLFGAASHARWVVAFQLAVFSATVLALLRVARTPYAKAKPNYATFLLASLALCSASAAYGPLIIVPSLIMATMIGFLVQRERARRILVILASSLALLAPMVLDWVGLVPPAYEFDHGRMIITNRLIDVTSSGIGILSVGQILIVIAVGVVFVRFRDMLTVAEERVSLHAWQLRQLVPAESEVSTAAPRRG